MHRSLKDVINILQFKHKNKLALFLAGVVENLLKQTLWQSS